MRRTSVFTPLIALVIFLPGSALLLGSATAVRVVARWQAPANAQSSSPREDAPPGATVDLSGTYHGIFVVSATGETVPAVLDINGEKFTVTLGDKSSKGRIKPVAPHDYSVVEMSFDQGSPFGGNRTRTLRARKVGSRLSLIPISTDGGAFSFHSTVPLTHTYGEYASIDSNAFHANANANANANASFNANASSNTNPIIFPNPSPVPVDSNEGHAPRARSARRETRLPTVGPGPTGAENGNAAPAPTSTPANGDDVVEQEAERQLHDGQLALRAPDTMRQGEPQIITARISLKDIGSQLTNGMKGVGNTNVEPVRVSCVMDVSLMADEPDAFTIVKQGDSEQIITPPFAEWKWSVTPRLSGKHALHLVGIPKVKISDRGEKAAAARTIDKEIVIQVNYGYVVTTFLTDKENWKLIFGGVTIPGVLAGAWKFLRMRRRRGGGAPDGAGGGNAPQP